VCAYYNEDRMYMYICSGMVVVCGGNVYNIVEPDMCNTRLQEVIVKCGKGYQEVVVRLPGSY